MWHEARKQEKKIREVMVDFQKRAERRREHFEKTRVDPSYYIRVISTKCPVHLDPTGGKLNDTAMIPWQGDPTNMISRYDVRVHMDYIPENTTMPKEELSKEEAAQKNKCNYERFRSLIHHTYKGENENDVLAKLEVEDIFSDIHKKRNKDQKRVSKSKAAIGFDYDEGVGMSAGSFREEADGEEESSDDEYKMDFDVDELSTKQIDRLNVLALEYGVSRGFYSKSLRSEKSVLLERKDAKMMEMEKSAFSGKKARKERRQFKDKILKGRDSSPPLYLRRDSPTYEPYSNRESSSSSRSSSPGGNEGAMEFITEFGTDQSSSISVPRLPTTTTRTKTKSNRRRSPSHSPPSRYSSRDRHVRSRSRSRERRHHYRSRSRSRSPSRITKSKLTSKKPQVSSTSLTKQKTEKSKLTPQERLKRKMQAQLSKTFKEDKKAEKEKAVAKEVKEMEREEHLRGETRKLKERERHRLGIVEPSTSSRHSRSPSPNCY